MTTMGRGWLLGTLAAALVVGAVAGLTPLALLPVAAVLLVALALTRPVDSVLVALPLMLFGPTLAQYPGLQIAQYGDEGSIGLLVVAAVLRAVVRGQRVVHSWVFVWAAVFLGVGALSGLVVGVPLPILANGAVLAIKGWLFAWAVAQIEWSGDNLRRLATGCAWIVGFLLATSVVNAAAPGVWADLAGAGLLVEYRWVLPSLVGPFLYAIQFGQILSIVAGALLALAVCLRGRARTIVAWAAVLASISALMSFRRLAVLAVVLAVLIVLLVRRSAPIWTMIAAAAPLAVAVSLPVLSGIWRATAGQYLEAGSDAARTVLTLRAFDVAAAHFPLGAGLGRYGSFIAGEEYSPEYVALGFPRIYGLGPEPPNNLFLTDTFWPAVLGEGGYLGALAYGVAILVVFRTALRLFRSGSGAVRTVALMTATVWAQVLVLSPGGAVLTAGPNLVLPFLLLGVLCRMADDERRSGGQEDPPQAVPAAAATTPPGGSLRAAP
jgi:hypothetical protein